MQIKIWGCRGSLTTPGRNTLRYGGNTTCVEIRRPESPLIIIDAGSGVRELGKVLMAQKDLAEIIWLFTHAHWDHLNGFPFFLPAYSPRFQITLCGGPMAQESLRRYLSQQMEPPYFPITFNLLKAKFVFGCSCGKPDCAAQLPGASAALKCFAIPLSHPNGGYGFKLFDQGKTFVFLTDNELGFIHPAGLTRSEYLKHCAGADLLFHDAQYTDEDYQRTRGWGHSTYADAVDLALEAGVKRLGLFHHDPDRTDDDLDRQVEFCRARIAQAGGRLECFGCVEGMEIDLG
jgi:phosphoribosyl 1,2-cyclic phosphodiesterase